jgi:hypothetical protein
MPQMLLDDFSQDSSALGTKWGGFTDRVMGGRSDMEVGYRVEGGRRHLSMSGSVSLANNGGFIQARILLGDTRKAAFDASGYRGLKLVVPWSSFRKGDYGSLFSLNPAKLASVAIVAYKKAFAASIDVGRISFY